MATAPSIEERTMLGLMLADREAALEGEQAHYRILMRRPSTG